MLINNNGRDIVELIGHEGPGLVLLSQHLSGLEWPAEAPLLRVCWGGAAANALNSQRRLNAIEQLLAFQRAEVPTIVFTRDIHEAWEWVARGDLVFGRLLDHTRGKDIVGPRHRLFRRREWWSLVERQVENEWRIHIFGGRSIARGRKVQVEPPWRRMPVRNRGNGWRIEHTSEPPEAARAVAKAAVAACGYDFGGVDIIEVADGSLKVLEVNKQCGLDDYTASKYAEALRRWAAKIGGQNVTA